MTPSVNCDAVVVVARRLEMDDSIVGDGVPSVLTPPFGDVVVDDNIVGDNEDAGDDDDWLLRRLISISKCLRTASNQCSASKSATWLRTLRT